MNTKQMIGAVIGTVLKVVLAVIVILFVYKGALLAYDYGYRVFMEPAMTAREEGWDVTVEVTMGKNAMQIGELLEQKGLIREARLFFVQNLLSEYWNKLKPGVYNLNTSMFAKEMMAVMAAEPESADSSESAGS